MSIKSKARRCGIAGAIASLSNAAIGVHGRRKTAICGLSRYNLPFWHLSFRRSLADTHSQKPRNSLLFLRFCSIGSTKSHPNLSAKSAKLFLREPLSDYCGFEPQNTEQGMSNFSRERLLNTVILSESAFYLQSIHQLQSTYRFEIRYSATCGGQLHSRDHS
jgi:hypothetical protein